MAESRASDTFNAINSLKSNTSGNISVQNGRLYNDGAASYTTIGGNDAAPSNEAVRAEDNLSLTRCKNFTGTGDLTVSNGNIRVTGHGTVTLI